MKVNEKVKLIERRFRRENLRNPATDIHIKLPNEPICHFGEVAVNQPFTKRPSLRTRQNEPIFQVSPPPNFEFGRPQAANPQQPIPVNPTKSHLENKFFFRFPFLASGSHRNQPPDIRQNLTGQTALVLRLYGPVWSN